MQHLLYRRGTRTVEYFVGRPVEEGEAVCEIKFAGCFYLNRLRHYPKLMLFTRSPKGFAKSAIFGLTHLVAWLIFTSP